MPVRVLASPRAAQQIEALHRRDRQVLDTFIGDLAVRGCAALAYRLTGPTPLDRLCVKHLVDTLRVVVGFASDDDAWILLVGPHDDRDPGLDVYTGLYTLAGIAIPDSAKRTKPPCCAEDGAPPLADDDAVEELVRRAARLRQTRRATHRRRR